MWIYAINGKNIGPVSLEEIVKLIQEGTIGQQTVVCEIGQKPCRAGQNPKLSSLFQNVERRRSSEFNFANTDNTPQNTSRNTPITQNRLQKSSDLETNHKVIKSPMFIVVVGVCGLIALAGILFCGAFFMQSSTKKLCEQAEKYYNNGDYNKAVELYKKAAKHGNANAQNKLGKCYESGKGVKQDYVDAFKWYQKAAEQGNADAQYALGSAYIIGAGVEKDYVEAAKWLRKSAEQGNPKAQYWLGVGYYSGDGVEKDYVEAVKWIRKAAEQGDVQALCSLGDCYASGNGVVKDYVEAVKWYRKAAEQGNAEAQCNLGTSYIQGNGVEKDYAEAIKWYRKAAEQGNAEAQCNLGTCYIRGNGVEINYFEATKWYRKSAEQGIAEAQHGLGMQYISGNGVDQDYTEAVKWFRKAAEQGYVQAQCILGTCYLQGNGVAQDYTEAVQWYRKAAEQGNAEAQFGLGHCYIMGNGIKQDSVEAVKWFRKAAEQGNVPAQFCLGTCYLQGNGVVQDYTEAIKCFRKAAEQGNAEAQFGLGTCYLQGNGVKQDSVEAVEWFRKSAEQENMVAQYFLGICYIEGDGVRIDKQEGLRWITKAADQGNEQAIKFLKEESQKEETEDKSIAETETKEDNEDEFIPQHAKADGSLITILPENRGNTVTERHGILQQKSEPDDPNRFVQIINGIPFVYRWCPAGEFTMGSPEDEEDRAGIEKQHKVKLSKGFWILETEVTYRQWYAITTERLPQSTMKDDYPVENVSWNDCITFCQACKDKGMNVKLPTEAQWEYACRAGTDGPFAGNFESLTCYLDNSGGHACRVKEYSANSWKIYGMHGNVAEWCADWGGPYKLEDQTDPTGPGKGTKRVTRGGSWGSSRSFCRSAFRGSLEPNKKTPGLGFRLILLGHDKEE